MSIGGDCGSRKYRTKEEARVALLKSRREHYNAHKESCREKQREYYKTHKERYIERRKVYKEERREYDKQYRKIHIERVKLYYQDIKKQKGILSWKERFEKRYKLSRPLTNKEWNIWREDRTISGNKDKSYVKKFLQSLPNLTFTIPPKNKFT